MSGTPSHRVSLLRRALGAMLALLLLGTACSSGKKQEPTPRSTASSPGGAPTVSPSASPTAPNPSAAKVVYSKDGDLWLYTVASDSLVRLTNTASVTEFDPKFINADRISFITADEPQAVIREMRLSTKAQKVILKSQNVGRILVHAWSPARTTIAYLTEDHAGEHHALRYYVLSSKSNKSIRTFGAFEGREFTQDDSISVEWAPDGTSVLIVATPLAAGGTMFVVRASRLNVIPARNGTFARYSRDGKRIYYREFGGQKRWYQVTVPGNVSNKLSATTYTYRMSLSPDGKSLAYDNGAPNPSTYVYTLASSSQRHAGRGIQPLWLTNVAIAVENTNLCTPTADDPCFEPYKRTGTVNRLSLTGDHAKRLTLKATDGDVLYQ